MALAEQLEKMSQPLGKLCEEKSCDLEVFKKEVMEMIKNAVNRLRDATERFCANEVGIRNQLKSDFQSKLQDLKKDFIEKMNNFKSKHETQVHELKVEIEMLRYNEGLMHDRLKVIESKINGNCIQKTLNLDSKTSKLEHTEEEKLADLTEVMNKNKILRYASYYFFPIHQVNTVGLLHEHLKEFPTYKINVSELKKKHEAKSVVKYEVFLLPEYEVEAYAKITFKEDNTITINFIMEKKENPKEFISLDVYPRVFIIMKDKSKTEKLKDLIRTAFQPFKSGPLTEINYVATLNYLKLSDSIYNVSDSLSLDFYVESPSQARHFFSHNGTLFGVIGNYSDRQKRERDGLLLFHLSPYFYTHFEGYRVQAEIYVNGSHKNGRLTIGISFQNGEYDSKLDASFHHRTTVTVFNPSNPDQQKTKSIEKEDIKELYYEMDIGSDEEIKKLLVYDVLFYKVTIEKI